MFLPFFVSPNVLAQPASSPKRRALVIGNTQYKFLPPIPAARAGADAIATVLRDLHFEVMEKNDLTLDVLGKVIETDWIPTLRAGEVCLVYYSGYGFQHERENYVVATDFDPNSKGDANELAYDIGRLQQLLDGKDLEVKILFLEASWQSDEITGWANAVGLAPQRSPSPGTMLVFDTLADRSITETSGNMGLFTAALVTAVQKEGSCLPGIAGEVAKQVSTATKRRQEPSPVGVAQFCFIPPPPVEKETWPKQGSRGENKDRQFYVYIPKGHFLMGCVPSPKAECEPNEKPQHRVEIKESFWLGETEVEVEAYRRFVKDAHRKMPNPPLWNKGWKLSNYPIVYVTWEDAQAYCGWAGGRLPTEAEWEYAARAGIENQEFPFADMKQSREKANFMGKAGNDQYDDAAPVRQFDPNKFGLYDMAGNVWEWVNDWYSPAYYERSPKVAPQGPSIGKGHVARGGSYDSAPAKHLRLSFRGHFEGASNNLGFRCLLPDTTETQAHFKTAPSP